MLDFVINLNGKAVKVFSAVPDSPGSPLAPFVTDGGRLAPGGPWTPGSPLSPLPPGPPGVPSLPGNPGSPGEENVRIRDIWRSHQRGPLFLYSVILTSLISVIYLMSLLIVVASLRCTFCQ